MEIRFVKTNPTQNMTILVESLVPRQDRVRVAAALMDYGSVHAEQVGFLEQPQNPAAWGRLQMTGGEFCGNATMSLAAFLVWQRGETGEEIAVPLETSGVEGVFPCRVRPQSGVYRTTVALPPPRAVRRRTFDLDGRSYEVDVVHLDGIAHMVLPVHAIQGDSRAFALRAIEAWSAHLEESAQGILLFDEAAMRIEPLVRVPSAGSLVWERGCGSGSAAIGVHLASRRGRSVQVDVAQPGGVISVDAEYVGEAVKALAITGNVRVAVRGIAYI